MLSVLIPSRNRPEWPYTQKTIDDIFTKASGEIEVLITLDGYEPNPPLVQRPGLRIFHNSVAQGMRQGINAMAAEARGDFIMKCDDHCMFAPGFDTTLAGACDGNWLAVPSRYALNGALWERKYGPIDYLYLTYPFNLDEQFGWGFHGKKWYGEHGVTGRYFDREKKLRDIRVDDILAFQGSCWFMPRAHFFGIGGMQTDGFLEFAQEAQELCFKTWLSGGRVVVNKDTWYAHLHKGAAEGGRGYHLLSHHKLKSEIFSTQFWLGNRWPGQIRTLKSLIEDPHWWPMERWPEDWDSPARWENYDYSIWKDPYRIRSLAGTEFVYCDDVARLAGGGVDARQERPA